MNTTNIYVLRLKGNRYYVGKTDNVSKRFQEHMNGKASSWTKKYAPLDICEIRKNVSPFEEDKITKEYMSKYGIDKVRGGVYVKENLDESQITNLKKEIWGANDCCTTCGKKGHFASSCYSKLKAKEEYEEVIVYCCEYCDSEFSTESKCEFHVKYCNKKYTSSNYKNKCYNCGKVGHYASNCYSKKHTYYSDSDDFDSDSDSDFD